MDDEQRNSVSVMHVAVEIVWLPSFPPPPVLLFIVQHVKECFDADLLIEDPPLYSSEDEESFVTIFGKLILQEYNYEVLIERWCEQEVVQHQMWLSLDKEKLFDAHPTLDNDWIDVVNLSFGTMVELNKFAEHYSTKEQNMDKKLNSEITDIEAYFQHDIKLLSVYFHVRSKNVEPNQESAATCRLHRFDYCYSAIDKVLIRRRSNSMSIDVYFYVSHPPLLYIVELPKDAENKQCENYINQSPDTTYSRIDTFADCSHSNIGLSTILKLQLSPEESSWDAICNFILNAKTTKSYFSPIFELPKRKCYPSPEILENQFNCIYALECLLSRSHDVIVQIYEKQEALVVNNKLNIYAKDNPKALEDALFDILASFEQKKIVNFSKALDIFYHKYDEEIRNSEREALSVPKNMIAVRRAILTPTRIILLPPQPYFQCRFFRDFESEYTIRLSVKDDNISNLSFTLHGRPNVNHDDRDDDIENSTSSSEENNNSNEECTNCEQFCNSALEKIRKQLLKGFKVGKRHYELLGCSPSHFREHGILFYAKDLKQRNSDYARHTLGDFSDNKRVPSKYMARLGQVFSQSLDYITVSKAKIKIEDDIKIDSPDRNKPYLFSDGIGKISPSIARKVFKKLDVKHNPSAIQIRYAGFKGMLTQWPKLKDCIVFRKSMKKFESDSEYLDILKVSKPRLVFLNRPFITILSQLGVPDKAFLKLQNNGFEKLFESLASEKDATDLLHRHSMLRIDYKSIHKAGVNILQEPFFLSMVKNIFEQQLVKMTTKARIMIPPDKGRTMFGVLDETKTLEYGQVFVQYTEDETSEDEFATTKILNEKIILVTKNPCMHPGDVRKFEAVDIEALHHIKDCIVFPAKGSRPHPNEMAGSDLDGDEYSVIWEEELIFECNNYAPMIFPADDAIKLNNDVQVQDMIKFFCDYIAAAQIGKIATAHLVHAEIDEKGIFSQCCKNLANKFSVALDFAKSGKHAQLSGDEQIDIYPDYLEKEIHSDMYFSKSILGQLYHCSKRVLLGFEGLECTAKYDADEELNCPGLEIYRNSAEEALYLFNSEIDSILRQYGIKSEGELFSGAILQVSKYISVKQDLNDLSSIEHRIKKLFKEMQKRFYSELLNISDEEKIVSLIPLIYERDKEKVYQKASAWYMITYDKTVNEKQYFGLPWVIHGILCSLKEDQKNVKKMASSGQFEERMNNIIMENLPQMIHKVRDGHLEVIQTVFEIINDWMSKQPLINCNNYQENEELLSKICNEVKYDLEQDHTENISIYRIVLKYLTKLSSLIFRRTTICALQQSSGFLKEEIVGLMAFKALLNILFRHEFNSSFLVAADMKSFERVFRVPLSTDNFFYCISHKRDDVIELLKEWTKVEEIELKVKSDRQSKSYVLFVVKGNKYALHHFQQVIFQNFHIAINELVSSNNLSTYCIQ